MQAQLKTIVNGTEVSGRADVLVKGSEVVCPELSSTRIVLERVKESEGLLVLRMARRPSRPKAIPAHFLLLEIVDVGDGSVWVQTTPVMTLPGRKNGFDRDVPTVVREGED